MDRKIYVVGDIHGCYREIIALEKLIYKEAEDQGVYPFILSVGDLIDRGFESRQVMEHFARGMKEGTHGVVVGNHEAMFLEVIGAFRPDLFEAALERGSTIPLWYTSLLDQWKRNQDSFLGRGMNYEAVKAGAYRNWAYQGGEETLVSFGNRSYAGIDHLPVDAVQLFMDLPIYWQNEDIIITHALAEREDLAILRKAVKDKVLVENGDLEHAVFSAIWNRHASLTPPDSQRLHISGHTPAEKPVKSRTRRRIMIDTACAFGYYLTAWSSVTGKFLSVKKS
jgi:diadenosine tetraphosphatase ApaH/serine/threonine PP2A family protein phosphatase